MWPYRVSNPGPMNYESDALPAALRGPAKYSSQTCPRESTKGTHKNWMLNPIALRTAKTPQSFGHFECNRVKTC